MKTSVVVLGLLFILCMTSQVEGQTQWIKDPDHLAGLTGEFSTWNGNIWCPFVLWNADLNRYEMWFSARPGGSTQFQLGFAVSPDGGNWTMPESNPVLTPGPSAWDAGYVCSPVVLRENGDYTMWYMGGDNGTRQIGVATSHDGIHWTKYTHNPVLSADQTWEGTIVGNHFVMRSGVGYRMWYAGGVDQANAGGIGVATSFDGVNGVKDYAHNPVLPLGNAGAWDATSVWAPRVVQFQGEYYMWYSASGKDEIHRVGMAVSGDGVNWLKNAKNPILTPSVVKTTPSFGDKNRRSPSQIVPDECWDSRQVEGAYVMMIGNTFHMWYAGLETGACDEWNIGHAVAPSPQSFFPKEIRVENPYVDPGTETVGLTALVNYPRASELAVKAFITANGLVIDSVRLYDNGNHHAGVPGEGVWGGEWYNPGNIEYYSVLAEVIDPTDGTPFVTAAPAHFTTAGPVVVDSYTAVRMSGQNVAISIRLRNDGSTAINGLMGTLSSGDARVLGYTANGVPFGRLGPGERSASAVLFVARVDTTGKNPTVAFTLSIGKDYVPYWSGSIVASLGAAGESGHVGEGEASSSPANPERFSLGQNYPNPFNPVTTIEFALPEPRDVTLTVYDMLGRTVATLVQGRVAAGVHRTTWNAGSAPNGVYLYRLTAGTFTEARKLVLMK